MPKMPKHVKVKKDGVINTQNYNFKKIRHGKVR